MQSARLNPEPMNMIKLSLIWQAHSSHTDRSFPLLLARTTFVPPGCSWFFFFYPKNENNGFATFQEWACLDSSILLGGKKGSYNAQHPFMDFKTLFQKVLDLTFTVCRGEKVSNVSLPQTAGSTPTRWLDIYYLTVWRNGAYFKKSIIINDQSTIIFLS